jgi:hypothetical protein
MADAKTVSQSKEIDAERFNAQVRRCLELSLDTHAVLSVQN